LLQKYNYFLSYTRKIVQKTIIFLENIYYLCRR